MQVVVATLSSACAPGSPQPMLLVGAAAPPRDQLYQAGRVRAARLADTPDGTSLAPVLTERSAYPSEAQLQFAFERSRWAAPATAMSGRMPDDQQMASIDALLSESSPASPARSTVIPAASRASAVRSSSAPWRFLTGKARWFVACRSTTTITRVSGGCRIPVHPLPPCFERPATDDSPPDNRCSGPDGGRFS